MSWLRRLVRREPPPRKVWAIWDDESMNLIAEFDTREEAEYEARFDPHLRVIEDEYE